MKKNLIKKMLVLAGIALSPVIAGAADYELHNGPEIVTGILSSASTDVLIGPGAVITVNGDWYITANNLYIHPTATITGTGTIHLMSPSTYFGKPANVTRMDAGSVTIGCKLSIENNNTVTLAQIDPAGEYPASGFTETFPQLMQTNLVIGNTLNFNNAGAHVFLDNFNVIITSSGTITRTDLNTAGFSPDPTPGPDYSAYFITSSNNSPFSGTGPGIVTKQGVAGNDSFTFPIGQSGFSIAPFDYTPATVTNLDGSAHAISAKVASYAASSATEGAPAKGINRTWLIYGDASMPATVSLTHNTANNNAGNTTNGSSFNNTAAFVTRQLSPGNWSADTVISNGGSPVSMHSSTFTLSNSALSATSSFSKSSDIINSISDVIAVSPVVMLQGSMNGTTMRTSLLSLNLIPLKQPYGTQFAYNGQERVSAIPANVTDWVMVELRDANTPATLIAQRAAFVRNDGTVIDLDGTAAIGFKGVPAGNYYVAIRHRNHLGIRTPAALNLTLNGTPAAHNYSTAQSQAYQNGSISTNPAMKDMGNGLFAMWCGNGANTGAGATTVRVTGAPVINDYSAILTTLSGAASLAPVYRFTDYNMDGTVRATGAPAINDYTFLLNILVNNISITQHQ